MNPTQRDYLKHTWSELRERFREIGARQPEYELEWDEVADNIRFGVDIFHQIVDSHVEACKFVIEDLESPSKTRRYYTDLMDQLYGNLYRIRRGYLGWFVTEFRNRLVYYLFINDLILSLCKKFPVFEKVKYIIGPTGALQTQRFGSILAGRPLGLLDTQLKKDLANIIEGQPVHGIECDPGESLDRQMVLGHELSHILLRIDKELLKQVSSIYHNREVQVVFKTLKFSPDHVIELFCDFSAAWHFGPAYGKAFMEEILHYPKYESASHPSRIRRLGVILDALSGKLKSPYLAKMRAYYREHGEEEGALKKSDVAVITKEFKRILKSLGSRRYIPRDVMAGMRRHIRDNIPIIFEDIRDFVNNLPADKRELPKNQQVHYDDFLKESLRKTVMWRQFTQKVKELGLQPLLAPTLSP